MKLPRKPGMPDPEKVGSSREEDESSGTFSFSPARAGASAGAAQPRRTAKRGYLDGQMLIAMPTMGDERFARSVIYVCAHSSEGAMGIVLNHPASHVSFRDLLVQLEVVSEGDKIELPQHAS